MNRSFGISPKRFERNLHKGNEMSATKNILSITAAVFLAAGVVACDKPGPAESAGKSIDQKVDEMGNKIEKTGNQVADTMSHEGEKAGVAIDDTGITAKVKAAILAEPGLRTLQISVKTINGVVTLSGSVATAANRDTAEELAGAVAGVSRVKNDLVAKK